MQTALRHPRPQVRTAKSLALLRSGRFSTNTCSYVHCHPLIAHHLYCGRQKQIALWQLTRLSLCESGVLLLLVFTCIMSSVSSVCVVLCKPTKFRVYCSNTFCNDLARSRRSVPRFSVQLWCVR